MDEILTVTWGTGLCLMLEMVIVWILARQFNFLSLVDFFWVLGIGVAALVLVLLSEHTGMKGVVTSALILIWSLRLSAHLYLRLRKHFPTEDPRYQKIKASWSSASLFLFFQFQAFIQLILLYPLIAILNSHSSPLSGFVVLGGVIAVLALIGEVVADAQLKRFKASRADAAGPSVCEKGLWRYSRHPNYFFEWLFWCGIALLAVSETGGWLALSAPALMYILLVYVTGVKPSEASSLHSKGVAYENYQRRTNRFFPWFQRTKLID